MMRRTYRSKKDTAGVLDHRDAYLNMDEKSSAFDAFYIQNIKQTKREISCDGSSNQYGVASNKVRKRKYVKRIIREVEPARRETMSRSTYLTPDKSIRVNKALDPFDLLLNSSPTFHVESKMNNSSFDKVLLDQKTNEGLYDKLPAKIENKYYTRKKQSKARKFDCSNQSTDSDKENTDNEQPDTTDIRTHELLVEREPANSPKYLDESINKIVENISLLNNLKCTTSRNIIRTSFKCNINSLTENKQSPIQQTSPLCSTPFKVKYRGESIYKFSPISLKQHDVTPNYVTDRTNENSASIMLVKDNVTETSSQEKQSSPVIHLSWNNLKKCNTSRSLINEIKTNSQTSSLNVNKENMLDLKKGLDAHQESKALSGAEITYFEITDGEPFLGFSNVEIEDSPICAKNVLVRSPDKENAMPCQDTNTHFVKEDIDNVCDVSNDEEKSFNINVQICENNISVDSQDSEIAKRSTSSINKTLLDSDDSDKCLMNENLNSMNSHDPKHVIKNKSCEINMSFVPKTAEKTNKHNNKNNILFESDDSSKSNNTSENNHSLNSISGTSNESIMSENNISLDCHHSQEPNQSDVSENNNSFISGDSARSNETDMSENSISLDSNDFEKGNINRISLNYQSSEKESMYDTCDSEQSSLEDSISIDKQPKVMIDRINDSLFMRYYKQMANYESQDEEDRQTNASYASDVVAYASLAESISSVVKPDNSSSMELHSTENKLENNQFATDSSDVSEDDDMESSSIIEEERCISFVTTRRRNDMTIIPNDSMYIFDNSYETASSRNCDKTVLSNSKICLTPKEELDIKIAKVNIENHIDSTKMDMSDIDSFKCISNDTEDKDIKVSTITTRKSSRLCRQSNVTLTYGPSETDLQESGLDIIEDQATLTDKNEVPTVAELNEDNSLDDTNFSEYSDARTSITTRKRSTFEMPPNPGSFSKTDSQVKPGIVLQPGKKWERSLSIYRRMTMMADHFDHSIFDDESLQTKGRKYRQSVISTMEMQECTGLLHNDSINSRRSTFVSKPCRSTIRFVKDPDISTVSLSTTTVYDDLKGFLNEECDDTLIELSKLSIADAEHEVTVLDNFHDTSDRLANARDYVLRRCNQADAILFDECYPDTVLKNCHKIGEGVYGEVFLWRGRDGRARVMKIVPIAGTVKVNGECQKDYDEIISEIVIAMELSALRAPVAEIDAHFVEGKDTDTLDLHAINNATDVFNEVLAVRYVYGSYPSRLLDLWELFDECKGSENDNPGILPIDQHYIVLELANAGQDLESYQFNNAEQAHALFLQVAFGLAVGEEAFQFEHRDLHWGNVLIAPTDQKYATFILRGRPHRVYRRGVSATIIDYSLSRLSLPLAPNPHPPAALYNDLGADEALFDALGDYQFEIYRLMRDKLGNDWKNFEPYTNILWLHYTVDKMITALRYKRTNTKLHKQYIEKLKGIKDRILNYRSAVEFVLTDNE